MRRGQFPHLAGIADQPTRQSLLKLWERNAQLEEQVAAAAAERERLQHTLATLAVSHAEIQRQVANLAAVTLANQATSPTGSFGGQPSPPTTDNGLGALGCSEAGATGHLTSPIAVTAESVGKIVCGVGNEFPSLLAIAVDQPTRDANRDQLLDRMVWHLNLAGFPTSRYPTANGRPWTLLIQIGADQYAYRVIDYAAGDFTIPYTTTMVFGGITPGATVIPDGGIPD